jgi:hypothetical protein
MSEQQVGRCLAEITEIEWLLKAGHPELEGLLRALSDWCAEFAAVCRTSNRRKKRA